MSTPTKAQLQATARELGVSDEGGTRDLIARIREARASGAGVASPADVRAAIEETHRRRDEELDLVLPTADDGDPAAGLEPPAPPPPPSGSDPAASNEAPKQEPPTPFDLEHLLADAARRRSAGASAVFAMAYAPDGEVIRLEVTDRGPAAWVRAEELVAIAGGGDLQPAVVTVEPGAGQVRLSDRTVDVDVGATI